MPKTFTVLALLAAAAAVAETQPPFPVQQPRIGVIDLERVGTESRIARSYAERIRTMQKEVQTAQLAKETALKTRDQEIEAMEDELETQASLLSEEALEEKKLTLKKRARDRAAFVEDGKAELERMTQRVQSLAQSLQEELQAKIRPHLETVAREQQLDLLLDKRSTTAINPEFDVSNAVIARLDEAEAATGGAPAADNR
jgi:Skp family chaperone for outer membrane proteins